MISLAEARRHQGTNAARVLVTVLVSYAVASVLVDILFATPPEWWLR